MPTQFSATSVIVSGAWNPAILSPEWMRQYKIIDPLPKEPDLELDIPSHRLKFSSGSLSWSIDHGRLEVKLKELRDCGQYVARILGLLSHTPVQAIGTNFIFKCPAADWPADHHWGMPGVDLNADQAVQVQWAVVHKENETRIRYTTTRMASKDVMIAFNFHRAVENATRAAEFAGKWGDDKDLAESFIKTIYKLEYE